MNRQGFLVKVLVGLCALAPLACMAQQPGPIFFSGFDYQPLNDTGMVFSGYGTNGLRTGGCLDGDSSAQDCFHGRDAAAAAGTLNKVGGSTKNNNIPNGFDYTKVCNSGEAAGEGNCPANPSLGGGPNAWACTRDNVTGLLWEVKTDDGGLRDKDWTYTWYDSNSPDGNLGDKGDDSTCYVVGGFKCNTQDYTFQVNSQKPCGYGDWRMPTVDELAGLADFGRAKPAIDPAYFPNTPSSVFWSGSPNANNSDYAWSVNFYDGHVGYNNRYSTWYVRLVRGGQ